MVSDLGSTRMAYLVGRVPEERTIDALQQLARVAERGVRIGGDEDDRHIRLNLRLETIVSCMQLVSNREWQDDLGVGGEFANELARYARDHPDVSAYLDYSDLLVQALSDPEDARLIGPALRRGLLDASRGIEPNTVYTTIKRYVELLPEEEFRYALGDAKRP